MIFNIIHGLVEVDIPNLLQFSTSNDNRGYMRKLVKTNCKTYQELLGEMQRIAFRILLSTCECVSVCVSLYLCVCRVCGRQETICGRDVVFLNCVE